ncbi:MAG: fatty acid desaturase [Leptolyngbyaceae cyanobacterium MAG.088]|nr:fatty acid desaturase [Leptolyngbyaceae cyanobacterium MAG.088]
MTFLKIKTNTQDLEKDIDHKLCEINFDAFAKDIDCLRKAAEVAHPPSQAATDLKRFASTSIIFGFLGWLTAPLGVNPVSILLLSLGTFSRWILAHHICHGAYDRTNNLPAFVHRNRYGRGWRRWLDWLDWMPAEAWHQEHNRMHHYNLNVPLEDPDLVEDKIAWISSLPAPRFFKMIVVFGTGCVWKPLYYGPSTLCELWNAQWMKGQGEENNIKGDFPLSPASGSAWVPWRPTVWRIAARSWVPYILVRFIAPYFIVDSIWGHGASTALIINLILAEVLTNFHGFVTIAPNHAGEDLYRFTGKPKSKGEFYIRQILGSCNYQTGSWWGDFLQGWLNYQIEHHIWPDMTLSQYQWVQPKVKQLCADHGIPYIQEPIWQRCWSMIRVSIGDTSMLSGNNFQGISQ